MKDLIAFVKRLFLGLKWYEASEYALMMAIAVTMPLQWHISLWCLVLLCANTLARIIATHHIGNPALDRPTRICLYLMVLFYLLFALSGTYSNNPDEAISTITTMLPLLLFPLIFLLSDTRYLTRRHLSLLAYLLATTLTIRFGLMLIRSAFHSIDSQLFAGITQLFTALLAQIVSPLSQLTPFPQLYNTLAAQPIRAVAHLFNNTPFEHLKYYIFDPLHHNYLALYILTAITLLYTELVRHWHTPRWHRLRWFVIIDIGLLSSYILLSGSRSGMVAWVLLATACLLHLAFCRHKWRTIGIILATTVLIIGITYCISPKTYSRVTDTAKNIHAGEEGDVRQNLWQCGLEIAKDQLVFGYGCDGYWDSLFSRYKANDQINASISKFSTHNQYLETTLAIGLIGLVVMLAMIIFPVILSFRRPHRNLPMILFTVVYATCIFFEATFGRQMGLLFIGFWYCIILHYSRPNIFPAKTA